MIIKGRAVGNIKHWARYLKEAGENETVIEHEIRGTVAGDLKGALEEMRDLASITKSEGNFLYHASFNPRAGETLTPAQWQQAIDLVEERLGMKDHQRIVYEHVKNGRQHYHVLWNRTDPDSLIIRDIKGDRYTLRRCANELERDFGLTSTKAVRGYDDPRPFEEWEKKQEQRSRIEAKQMKEELTKLWHTTDSGKAFIAAAEERGYAVAKGDRRDFVVLDRAGGVHSLARRLDGVRAADLRDRFSDVERDSLPSVRQARENQRARLMEQGGDYGRDAAAEARDGRPGAEISPVEAARDERRREGRNPPILDRDEADRSWQNEIQNAAIERDKAGLNRHPLPGATAAKGTQRQAQSQKEAHAQTQLNALESAEFMPANLATLKCEAGMLHVADSASRLVLGLAEFLIGFLDGSEPPEMSQSEKLYAERRREIALENMRESLARDEPLRSQDLIAMPRHELAAMRQQGDPYLRDLLARLDRERQHYLGRER